MQSEPVAFLIVFQLGLRDLGVGILPLFQRSIAPLRSDSKIVEFLSVAFVENQKAKRHKFTEKSILQHSTFPFPALLFDRSLAPGTEVRGRLIFNPRKEVRSEQIETVPLELQGIYATCRSPSCC